MTERTSGRLAGLVRRFAEVKVLVVGDVILDRYVEGSVTRVSPEAPVPVIHERGARSVLGGAANVAATVVAIGAQAVMIGRLGDDPAGDEVLALAAAQGIDVARCHRSSVIPTTTKTRFVAGYQQSLRVDREVVAPLSPPEVASVLKDVERFLAGSASSRVVVLSDYAKGFLSARLIGAIIERATAVDVPVVADPKVDVTGYDGVTILKPNLREAIGFLGPNEPVVGNDDGALRDIAERVKDLSGARNVIMTLSERGVIGVGDDFPSVTRSATTALAVADVSGAGDTMVAYLAIGIAAGMSFPSAMDIANEVAGLVCAKPGTATLGVAEFLRVIGHREPRDSKVLAAGDETRWLGDVYRNESRTLVFANGCFDVLHAGHIALLRHARSLGDGLIVALNSDKSVSRLKGPTRPINPSADRVAVMSELECVDHVVVFDEDTPQSVIRELRPQVIVKGGDYEAEAVVGAHDALAWGGRVEIVPLVPGRSTTEILRRGASY